MTHESTVPPANGDLRKLSSRLSAILDSDPAKAVRQAREIDLTSSNRLHAMSVRAAILVDGGAATGQQDAMEEGLRLFREVYTVAPESNVAYNLANALVSIVGTPPHGPDWLDHQERTREQRAEARQLYWHVARDEATTKELRTQAWTNVANQFEQLSKVVDPVFMIKRRLFHQLHLNFVPSAPHPH